MPVGQQVHQGIEDADGGLPGARCGRSNGKGEETGLGKLRTGQRRPPLDTARLPWTQAALGFASLGGSFKTFMGTERSLWCPGRGADPSAGRQKGPSGLLQVERAQKAVGRGQGSEVTDRSGRVSQREGPRTAEA